MDLGFFPAVLSAAFVFATGRAERAVLAEAEARAKTSLDLVGFLLSREPGLDGEAGLAAFADALGAHLGFRLTYIVAGRVVADSTVHAAGLGEMEDHGDRPEVRLALRDGFGQDVRTSHTLGRDMVYVARAYPGGGGVPAGILRLALPVSPFPGSWRAFRDALLAVLALAFVAGGVAAFSWPGACPAPSRRSPGWSRPWARATTTGVSISWRPRFPSPGPGPSTAGRAHRRACPGDRGPPPPPGGRPGSMAEGVACSTPGGIVAGNRALREMFPLLGDRLGRSPIEAGMPLCVERALAPSIPRPARPAHRPLRTAKNGRVVELTVAVLAGEGDRAEGSSRPRRHRGGHMDRIFRDFVIDASHHLRTP